MTNQTDNKINKQLWKSWISILLLGFILAGGAYFRLVGLDWDENQHLHPDERFLTMVEAAIEPVESLSDYFDTANSSLNPHNRGYGFFVYGTLPIFIVRYTAEWLSQTGYGEVYLVGRLLSALMDLFVVLLVFLVAERLYSHRVGVLAAAFSAFAVLQIQQSHFFTVDTFTNFFMMLAVYFAIRISVSGELNGNSEDPVMKSDEAINTSTNNVRITIKRWIYHPLFGPSIFFGIALGMAVASKINATPIAIVLPVAAVIYLLSLNPEEQKHQVAQVIVFLVIAGFVSLLAFRIFQPYAFSGPGFFGIKPNELWIENISSLRAQTSGDVDFPPALQWARRPVWFSFQNLVIWGLGIPLGILAWAGFIWMGFRIFKGEWKKHGLLWGWTAIYFVWQTLQWNSTMRYQLPIYPLLTIFAAWAIVALWDKTIIGARSRFNLKRVSIILVGGVVLGLTFAWAFAFTRIYTQPHTRVAATRWLFQNLPGPVNLSIQTDNGLYNQPLSFPQDGLINGLPYQTRFTPVVNGELVDIHLPHAVDKLLASDLSLVVTLSSRINNLTLTTEIIGPDEIGKAGGAAFAYSLTEPVILDQGEFFSLALSVNEDLGNMIVCGPLILNFQTIDGFVQQELPVLSGCLQADALPTTFEFAPEVDGILKSISMTIQVQQADPEQRLQVLSLEIMEPDGQLLFSGDITSEFAPVSDPRGEGYHLPVSPGVPLRKDATYTFNFSLSSGSGVVAFTGSAPANESSWDDGLPLRMDGYDPFGGIYQGGLNFEMYWDDNDEKFQRFVTTLDQADYILITSSRQWGSTTRVPERYPLTTEYYTHLLGCPPDDTIEWCYNVAEPGRFQGDLGFDLLKVFHSNPSLWGLEINDQFSEEAFTVYDHPKVFVLKKSENYDPDRVREILGTVDLTKVIRITPKQADSNPGNLLLPAGRLLQQRRGGTWSDYFNPDAPQNHYEILGLLLWYVSICILGWVVYPLVRFALPGLSDQGYPFTRLVGLLLLSLIVWLVGSAGIPFNRVSIGLALFVLVLLGLILGYMQRIELYQEISVHKKYYLLVEVLFLAFFLAGILIRFGNPDLWHPWKGGEKPMDFSYFNAVLKSTSFPPYDPWFTGGYINYYYYGFMLVGVLVKLLGILPSFAYNLILPTLFALIAMGTFSVVWNLVEGRHPKFYPAISGAIGMAVLGNLGIIQMFARGLQSNAVPGGNIDGAGFFSKLTWTFSGLFQTLAGAPLPIRMDEWYWNPSRVIAYNHGSPITEFPFFTFLYADLHAHLIALPVALLVLVWVVSVIRGQAWKRSGKRSGLQVGLGMLMGGLAIGALYPINLSDIYTYFPLGSIALIYAIWRYLETDRIPHLLKEKSYTVKRLVVIGLGVVGLYGLTQLLYQPYAQWYGQGYSEVRIWDGTHTPVSEYLTHWGIFLFIIVTWMFHETVSWMASTPVSALRKLNPYRSLISVGLLTLVFITLVLGINLYPDGFPEGQFPVGLGIHIAWLVLPLAVWSGVLILRPGLSDSKRITLFFIGTGLILTLMVELIVVSGDIGRMNTVFKFYLHAWTLFAISSGAALGWMFVAMHKWSFQWRTIWQISLCVLVFSGALYPLLGSVAKVMDRMEMSAPHTLDGMTYMQYSTYLDEGVMMDLSQDYNAIRWMQDNISGSPVIVEANSVEYHWGSRYTIYTGLPGVVGWNWHQRQQRTITSHDWVFERVDAVHEFYQTEDLQWTRDFLQKYDVEYIVYGQLEQAKYAGPGLEKFASQEGIIWREVFRDRDTVLFEVIRDR